MPGGTVCSVAVCRNNSKKAKENGEMLKFFTFPKDPLVRKEWMRQCRRIEFSAEYKRICSKHFRIEDYEDALQAKVMGTLPKKLRKSAIPSLHLLPELENIAPRENSENLEKRKKDNDVIIVSQP